MAGSNLPSPFCFTGIMGKIDPKFTEKLVGWLRKDHTDEAVIRDGAMLLLQLNRNQGLYQRIMRNPLRNVSKLEYEIKKHVNYRLKGYTINDIVKLDNEITPQVETAVRECEEVRKSLVEEGCTNAEQIMLYPVPAEDGTKVVTGKRPDHDKLPEDIQKIWDDNAGRWKKIKETYNLLLTLNAPCDRIEHLQLLKESWYKYKQEMCRYDAFSGTIDEMVTEVKGSQLSEEAQKEIDVAQSYISRSLPVLLEMVLESREPDFTEEMAQKLEVMRSKIQERVNKLLQMNVVFSDQRKADLRKCDISIELPTEDAEGNKPE